MERMRAALFFAFLLVVVIELVMTLLLSIEAVSYTLEELAILTARIFWLGIADKILIVLLFGTFVFGSEE